MTPEALKTLETTLRTACKTAQNEGLRITPGAFGIHEFKKLIGSVWYAPSNCVCPLGAFLLGKPASGYSANWSASKELGLNTSQVGAFTAGFDNLDFPILANRDIYELGLKLRSELCPQPKTPNSPL